jgi:Zn-dependent protease/CBS domain-containing protein
MDGSIKLFQVAGIDIRMHLTFPLILIWGALNFGLFLGLGLQGAAFGVLVTLLLFAIVVLHELGHAFAARAYGIPVQRIVLLPIGGVAELGRLPSDPRQELVIAIAGPAVNFALAVVMWLVTLVSPLDNPLAAGPLLAIFTQGALANPGEAVFRYMFVANLFLGIFNLIPAFPLDGGRVLRALLAMPLGYPRATALAVGVGQTVALLLGLWGVLTGNIFLIILAVFVYMAAGQEGKYVQLKSILEGVRVGQAFSRQAVVLGPGEPVQRAVEATLASFQSDFPICLGSQLIGLLTGPDVMQALRQGKEADPIAGIMRREFPVAAPRDSLFEVQQRMAEARVTAIPVVEHGAFVGLLTSRDIGELYQLLSINPRILEQPLADAGRASLR